MNYPSFPQYLKQKTARFADRVFLTDFGTDNAYTYRMTDEVTDLMAGGMKALGLEPGDRVALFHPNHSDFILAYMAIIKAGGVAVPINPIYTAHEVTYILEDSEATALIGTDAVLGLSDKVAKAVGELRWSVIKEAGERLVDAFVRKCGDLKPFWNEDAEPSDPAFIFYTSGTTGRPKGVILTHRNILFGGANTAQNYGLRETDVTPVCLPLVHIFANASPVLGSLNSGGHVVVMERFQTENVFDAFDRYRATWFSGVPTMFGYLLNAFEEKPRDTSTLRMGLSGGASLSVKHLDRFEELFKAPILEVYGLTESTGLVTANPVYGVRKAGSIGIAVSGVDVRLTDDSGRDVPEGEVGELIFRGPNASTGYWKRPEVTAANIREGWVHTGDLARSDAEGYYFIVGRKDELIISGGYNIYPREIEEILYAHPQIAEAAVIGVEDEQLGEVPKAFVALKRKGALTEEDILEHCRSKTARYKVPRIVEILDTLPKNPTGKILKKALPKDR